MEAQSTVFCGDYKVILQRLQHKKQFDLVFLDPPYALSLVPQALACLVEYGLLSQDAKVICETASLDDVFGDDPSLADSFEIVKQTRYGVAHVTILRYGRNET